MIIGEGKMVARIEPPMVGVAEAVEGADVDHGADLGSFVMASSVKDVTFIEQNRERKLTHVAGGKSSTAL
jgi:hypothetical protein